MELFSHVFVHLATLYPVPDTPQQRQQLLEQVKNRVDDLKNVIKRSKDLRYVIGDALHHACVYSCVRRRSSLSAILDHLEAWGTRIAKEKAIYHNLNMFNYDLGRQCLIADGWCPSRRINDVQAALRVATVRST